MKYIIFLFCGFISGQKECRKPILRENSFQVVSQQGEKLSRPIENIHFSLPTRSSQWQWRTRLTSSFSVYWQCMMHLFMLKMGIEWDGLRCHSSFGSRRGSRYIHKNLLRFGVYDTAAFEPRIFLHLSSSSNFRWFWASASMVYKRVLGCYQIHTGWQIILFKGGGGG